MSVTTESYRLIIIDRQPDFFLVRCGCGKGCSSCKYTGHRKLRVPSDWDFPADVFRCGGCKGKGCSSCDYVGAFVGGTPRVICGSCSGNGCSSCKYRGSHYIGNIP